MTGPEKREYRKQFAALQMGSKSAQRQAETAGWAKIPPELANTVATYAERLLEQAVIV
jgi:deoxyhypusine synthase